MKTNSLIYKTTKTKGGIDYVINIRLNDECKNGHQDFAITGYMYEAGKAKIDRNMIGGGAIGEQIGKAFSEFQIFEDLHLSDYLGNPMYATANGFYHLKNGLGTTGINFETFPAEFCKYYRLPLAFWDTISKAQNKIQFAIALESLGVRELWKSQADKAIKQLEKLTGNEFVIDSTKDQFGAPTLEEITEELRKVNTGYYTESAIAERDEIAKNAHIVKMRAETDKKIAELNRYFEIKAELFRLGGMRMQEVAIYYPHTQKIGFNWRGYGEKITESEANEIMGSSPILAEILFDVK